MSRLLRLLLLGILSFAEFPGGSVFAGTLKAELSPENPELGDQISLHVTVEGDHQGAPRLPLVDGISFVSSGTSSQISMINGTVTKSHVYVFSLKVKNAGTYTIPSIRMEIDGRKESTGPVTIKVTKPSDHLSTSKDSLPVVFVERSLNKQKPFEGEPLILTTRLYYRVQIADVRMSQGKSSEFRLSEIDKKEGQSRLGGQVYKVVSINSLLIPLKSGKIRIPPDQFQVQYVVKERRQRRRSIFGELFNDFGGSVREKSLATQEDTLQVKALPESGRPANFSGIVGNFSLKSSLSTDRLKQGETSTLSLEIEGYGLLEGMKTPAPDFPPELKVYPDKPDHSEKIDAQKGLYSKRVYKYALVPTKAGEIDPGTISLSYFNPKSGSYETSSTSTGFISVEAVEEEKKITQSPPSALHPRSQAAVASLGSDLIDLHRTRSISGSQTLTFEVLLGWGGVCLGLLLIYTFLLIFSKVSAYSEKNMPKRVRADAHKTYRSGRTSWEEISLRDSGNEEAPGELSRLFRTYLGDKFQKQGSSLTLRDIETILADRGLPEEARKQTRDWFNDLDQITYSGRAVSPQEGLALAQRADSIIGEIEKHAN